MYWRFGFDRALLKVQRDTTRYWYM